MCVCVYVREREKQRDRETEREREIFQSAILIILFSILRSSFYVREVALYLWLCCKKCFPSFSFFVLFDPACGMLDLSSPTRD